MGIYNGGLYSGIQYALFPVTEDGHGEYTVEAVDNFIDTRVRARGEQSIVSVFMIPKVFCSTHRETDPDDDTVHFDALDTGTSVYDNAKETVINKPLTLYGYKPRNLKLLTYPYTALVCDTLDNSKTYRFEYFNDKTRRTERFRTICSVNPSPNMLTVPMAYNVGYLGEGVSPDAMWNFTEAIAISGMPQCAFTIDSYRAWLAQQMPSQVSGLIGDIIGLGATWSVAGQMSTSYDPTVGGVAQAKMSDTQLGGAVAKSGVPIIGDITSMYIGSHQGDRAGGSQSACSTLVGARGKMPYFKTVCVRPEYAQIYDEFFDMYGYACEMVKVPNRNVRPHWTYTKTKDCRISGRIPNDDLEKIRRIYNKGITFWKHGAEVGKYRTLAYGNMATTRRAWGVNNPPVEYGNNSSTNLVGTGQAGHMGL